MIKLKENKKLSVFLVESMNASDRIVTSFPVAGLVESTYDIRQRRIQRRGADENMSPTVVTDYLVSLIPKQVDDNGLVIWYDPAAPGEIKTCLFS